MASEEKEIEKEKEKEKGRKRQKEKKKEKEHTKFTCGGLLLARMGDPFGNQRRTGSAEKTVSRFPAAGADRFVG